MRGAGEVGALGVVVGVCHGFTFTDVVTKNKLLSYLSCTHWEVEFLHIKQLEL